MQSSTRLGRVATATVGGGVAPRSDDRTRSLPEMVMDVINGTTSGGLTEHLLAQKEKAELAAKPKLLPMTGEEIEELLAATDRARALLLRLQNGDRTFIPTLRELLERIQELSAKPLPA